MAKIDIYTSNMVSLSTSLKKISSVIADAEKVAASVQSGLDFQVAAKSDISSSLSKARRRLKSQNEKVTSLSNLTATSGEEFANADGQMNKQVQSVIGKIKTSLSGIVRSVKDFFASLTISQHRAINDIFLATGGILGGAAIADLIGKINGTAGENREGDGSGGQHDAGAADGKVSGDETSVNAGNTGISEGESIISGKVKAYQGSDKDNGNYKDYSVVECFDSKYVLDQHDYNIKNSKGKNCGCMACGVAMMQHMRTGNVDLQPDDKRIWNDNTKETQWTFIKKVPDSSKKSVDDQLKIFYDNIKEGTPVMVPLSASNNKWSTHYLVVVGIRQGADINNLKKSDFLVADPNGGVIRTIEEAEKACGKVMRDQDNFTMWKANSKNY